MTSSPKNEEKLVDQQPLDQKRKQYQTPDIVYEGTISIRAGSPLGFNQPGDPFNEPK